MVAETERENPVETGGILMGYWSDRRDEVVVTQSVGPGPMANHAPGAFSPDHQYHRDEVARIYRRSEGGVTYLGDWHSHPGAAAYMSLKDRHTLCAIALDPPSRAPTPIMVVIGGQALGQVECWVFQRLPLLCLSWPWAVSRCSVRTFVR
jgi:integrative and conjugative element protein (TIGR02256 family)